MMINNHSEFLVGFSTIYTENYDCKICNGKDRCSRCFCPENYQLGESILFSNPQFDLLNYWDQLAENFIETFFEGLDIKDDIVKSLLSYAEKNAYIMDECLWATASVLYVNTTDIMHPDEWGLRSKLTAYLACYNFRYLFARIFLAINTLLLHASEGSIKNSSEHQVLCRLYQLAVMFSGDTDTTTRNESRNIYIAMHDKIRNMAKILLQKRESAYGKKGIKRIDHTVISRIKSRMSSDDLDKLDFCNKNCDSLINRMVNSVKLVKIVKRNGLNQNEHLLQMSNDLKPLLHQYLNM